MTKNVIAIRQRTAPRDNAQEDREMILIGQGPIRAMPGYLQPGKASASQRLDDRG